MRHRDGNRCQKDGSGIQQAAFLVHHNHYMGMYQSLCVSDKKPEDQLQNGKPPKPEEGF